MASKLTIQKIEEKIGQLQKSFECPICLDLVKNPISTRCDHKFCRHCILETIQNKPSAPCPLCKEIFTKRSLQPLPRLTEIVDKVRALIAGFQKDTGVLFSPRYGAAITNSQTPVKHPSATRSVSDDRQVAAPEEQQKHSLRRCSSKSSNVRRTSQKQSELAQPIFKDGSVSPDTSDLLKSHINISSEVPAHVGIKDGGLLSMSHDQDVAGNPRQVPSNLHRRLSKESTTMLPTDSSHHKQGLIAFFYTATESQLGGRTGCELTAAETDQSEARNKNTKVKRSQSGSKMKVKSDVENVESTPAETKSAAVKQTLERKQQVNKKTRKRQKTARVHEPPDGEANVEDMRIIATEEQNDHPDREKHRVVRRPGRVCVPDLGVCGEGIRVHADGNGVHPDGNGETELDCEKWEQGSEQGQLHKVEKWLEDMPESLSTVDSNFEGRSPLGRRPQLKGKVDPRPAEKSFVGEVKEIVQTGGAPHVMSARNTSGNVEVEKSYIRPRIFKSRGAVPPSSPVRSGVLIQPGTPNSDDPYAFKVSQRTPKVKGKKKSKGNGRGRKAKKEVALVVIDEEMATNVDINREKNLINDQINEKDVTMCNNHQRNHENINRDHQEIDDVSTNIIPTANVCVINVVHQGRSTGSGPSNPQLKNESKGLEECLIPVINKTYSGRRSNKQREKILLNHTSTECNDVVANVRSVSGKTESRSSARTGNPVELEINLYEDEIIGDTGPREIVISDPVIQNSDVNRNRKVSRKIQEKTTRQEQNAARTKAELESVVDEISQAEDFELMMSQQFRDLEKEICKERKSKDATLRNEAGKGQKSKSGTATLEIRGSLMEKLKGEEQKEPSGARRTRSKTRKAASTPTLVAASHSRTRSGLRESKEESVSDKKSATTDNLNITKQECQPQMDESKLAADAHRNSDEKSQMSKEAVVLDACELRETATGQAAVGNLVSKNDGNDLILDLGAAVCVQETEEDVQGDEDRPVSEEPGVVIDAELLETDHVKNDTIVTPVDNIAKTFEVIDKSISCSDEDKQKHNFQVRNDGKTDHEKKKVLLFPKDFSHPVTSYCEKILLPASKTEEGQRKPTNKTPAKEWKNVKSMTKELAPEKKKILKFVAKTRTKRRKLQTKHKVKAFSCAEVSSSSDTDDLHITPAPSDYEPPVIEIQPVEVQKKLSQLSVSSNTTKNDIPTQGYSDPCWPVREYHDTVGNQSEIIPPSVPVAQQLTPSHRQVTTSRMGEIEENLKSPENVLNESPEKVTNGSQISSDYLENITIDAQKCTKNIPNISNEIHDSMIHDSAKDIIISDREGKIFSDEHNISFKNTDKSAKIIHKSSKSTEKSPKNGITPKDAERVCESVNDMQRCVRDNSPNHQVIDHTMVVDSGVVPDTLGRSPSAAGHTPISLNNFGNSGTRKSKLDSGSTQLGKLPYGVVGLNELTPGVSGLNDLPSGALFSDSSCGQRSSRKTFSLEATSPFKPRHLAGGLESLDVVIMEAAEMMASDMNDNDLVAAQTLDVTMETERPHVPGDNDRFFVEVDSLAKQTCLQDVDAEKSLIQSACGLENCIKRENSARSVTPQRIEQYLAASSGPLNKQKQHIAASSDPLNKQKQQKNTQKPHLAPDTTSIVINKMAASVVNENSPQSSCEQMVIGSMESAISTQNSVSLLKSNKPKIAINSQKLPAKKSTNQRLSKQGRNTQKVIELGSSSDEENCGEPGYRKQRRNRRTPKKSDQIPNRPHRRRNVSEVSVGSVCSGSDDVSTSSDEVLITNRHLVSMEHDNYNDKVILLSQPDESSNYSEDEDENEGPSLSKAVAGKLKFRKRLSMSRPLPQPAVIMHGDDDDDDDDDDEDDDDDKVVIISRSRKPPVRIDSDDSETQDAQATASNPTKSNNEQLMAPGSPRSFSSSSDEVVPPTPSRNKKKVSPTSFTYLSKAVTGGETCSSPAQTRPSTQRPEKQTSHMTVHRNKTGGLQRVPTWQGTVTDSDSSPKSPIGRVSEDEVVVVSRRARKRTLPLNNSDSEDQKDEMVTSRSMNLTSSSAFSSQNEDPTTQYQEHLINDVENIQNEIKRLEAELLDQSVVSDIPQREPKDMGAESRDVGAETWDMGEESRDMGAESKDVGAESLNVDLDPGEKKAELEESRPTLRKNRAKQEDIVKRMLDKDTFDECGSPVNNNVMDLEPSEKCGNKEETIIVEQYDIDEIPESDYESNMSDLEMQTITSNKKSMRSQGHIMSERSPQGHSLKARSSQGDLHNLVSPEGAPESPRSPSPPPPIPLKKLTSPDDIVLPPMLKRAQMLVDLSREEDGRLSRQQNGAFDKSNIEVKSRNKYCEEGTVCVDETEEDELPIVTENSLPAGGSTLQSSDESSSSRKRKQVNLENGGAETKDMTKKAKFVGEQETCDSSKRNDAIISQGKDINRQGNTENTADLVNNYLLASSPGCELLANQNHPGSDIISMETNQILESSKSRIKYRPVLSTISSNHTVTGSDVSSDLEFPQHPEWSFTASGISKTQHKPHIDRFVGLLGASFSKTVTEDTTHILVRPASLGSRRCQRTLKYFQALAHGKWLLSVDWVINSVNKNRLLPQEMYEIVGDTVEKDEHFGPMRSRTSSTSLLGSHQICYLGQFQDLSKGDLRDLIEGCGGDVITRPMQFTSHDSITKIVILEADHVDKIPALYKLRAAYNCVTVSKEWLLDSIGTYTLKNTQEYIVEYYNDI